MCGSGRISLCLHERQDLFCKRLRTADWRHSRSITTMFHMVRPESAQDGRVRAGYAARAGA